MTSRSSVSAVADQGFHLMNEAKEVWEAVSRTFAVTDDGDGIWSRIRDHSSDREFSHGPRLTWPPVLRRLRRLGSDAP